MKNFYKNLLSAALLAAITVVTLIPQALALSTPALISLSNFSIGSGGPGQVNGWRFTAIADFQITALGLADINNLYNQPPSIGLEKAHSVTLWDNAGTSLASVTIQQGTGSPIGPGTLTFGSFGDGVFRYENLASPVSVSGGSQYVISAFYLQSALDPRANVQSGSVALFNSLITPGGSLSALAGSHVFPTQGSFLSSATFGPNFLIDQQVSVVPLPAALPLYGTGLALMGFIGWRRRQKSVAGAQSIA